MQIFHVCDFSGSESVFGFDHLVLDIRLCVGTDPVNVCMYVVCVCMQSVCRWAPENV